MPILKHLRESLSLLLVFLLVLAPLEARNKKSEKLVKDGQNAEFRKDWDLALKLFEQALNLDPGDQSYLLAVRRARFQAAQGHVDAGQKLRQAGKLEEAIAEFQKAFSLDPGSTIAEQELRRTYDMIKREKQKKESGQAEAASPEDRGLTPGQQARKDMEEKVSTMQGVPDLKPTSQRINNLKMNNQPVKVLWETLGKLAGINVMFDQDFVSQSTKNFSYEANNISIDEAFDNLAVMTKAYWKPLTTNSVFVTQDNVTKRRDYEEQVVKTFYLQNVTTPQELQEIATVIRTVTDIRRLLTYNGQMAMTIRGSVDQINLAQKVILDLDKAKAEVVIDIFVMEANRIKTRNLAAAIASSGAAGFTNAINFTPRNPILTGGTTTTTGTGSTATTTTTGSTAIALSKIGKISTNDYSVNNMPGLLLNAVMNDRQTRVLQNPSVRTLDSQKVTLKIGDKYPYATGSFQPGVGAIGVSPLVSTQFQFADVGVNIDLTPKIHGGEEVTMHIEIEVSNIRDQIDVGGLKQPVIGTRRVNEDVRVKEGEVTLLGGLTTLNNTRSQVGIPGLSNIPGLKWLTSTESKEDDRSELLIALVPRIVRAADISDVNMRGISAGNDQVVKVSFAPKPVKEDRPVPAPAPAAAAPAAVATPAAVPAPATPTQPQLPPALTPGGQPPLPGAIPGAPPIPGFGQPPAGGPPAIQPGQPGGQALLYMTTPVMAARLGELVNVTVQMTGATDLAAAPMKIRYDTKLLKLMEVSKGALLGGPDQVNFTRDLAAGTVKLSRLAGSGGVNGSGALVTLTFMALGKGSATIALDEIQLENSKREAIPTPKPELSLTIQ